MLIENLDRTSIVLKLIGFESKIYVRFTRRTRVAFGARRFITRATHVIAYI